VDGHYYWLLRINPADANARGIRHHGLVKVFNHRGAVICAADVSALVAPGVVKSFESSAVYQTRRSQSSDTESMAPNSCLVQIENWLHPITQVA
jgi:anaerobic selenocysteine-containing dehydrogenase